MASHGIRYDAITRANALALRTSGQSLSEISLVTGISKPTLSVWLKDAPMPPEWKKLKSDKQLRGARAGSAAIAKAKAARLVRWSCEATQFWYEHCADPLFVLGVGLYWGEGAKTHEQLAITNCDASLLRTWRRWCDRYLGSDRLKLSIYCHEDVEREKAAVYWKEVIGCAGAVGFATAIPVSSRGKRPRRIAPHGTARLRLRAGGVEWFHKMMRFIEIAKSAGIV